MSLLVVGSTALDSIKTPEGEVNSVPGGSSVYFSLAASFFSPVRLVGVIGEDFPPEFRRMMEAKSIDTEGLEVLEGGTFCWSGCYTGAMNEAETLDVRLNVFDNFMPDIPRSYRDSDFVFLANCSPHTQMHVRRQVSGKAFVMADTMNLWIETERAALLELFGEVNGVVLNDEEARAVSGELNLIRAARWICKHGPDLCLIKKAEHGALLLNGGSVFVLPGYPSESVCDPTGAGDSFAGAFLGRLAETGRTDNDALRDALAYATVTASFTIESFGTGRLCGIGRDDINMRLKEFRNCTQLQ